MTGSRKSRALACLHSTNKDRYQGSAVALALVQHQNLTRQNLRRRRGIASCQAYTIDESSNMCHKNANRMTETTIQSQKKGIKTACHELISSQSSSTPTAYGSELHDWGGDNFLYNPPGRKFGLLGRELDLLCPTDSSDISTISQTEREGSFTAAKA